MKLPVMEQFYTIQGEGHFVGSAAYFIRLAGCDVGCVWCDVKESWHTEGYPVYTPEELAIEAAKHPASIVVVTGGEPAMYDLTELCDALHKQGKRVHIETSGAHPIRGDFDWVTFSPKKFKAPLAEAASMANELKVVVFNQSDFKWAETHQKDVPASCELYLQPEWSKKEKLHDAIVSYVKEHTDWKIGIQSHKYIGVE
ncbi:MAG: radical SAM protein [Bacteroidia bacterium]|nr:radical SAM protein [Bacteroidia bacterium]